MASTLDFVGMCLQLFYNSTFMYKIVDMVVELFHIRFMWSIGGGSVDNLQNITFTSWCCPVFVGGSEAVIGRLFLGWC